MTPRPLRRLAWLALATLALPLAVHADDTVPAGSRATLTLLETTDIHANVLGYDYYRLKPDPHLGLDRTATLIRRARMRFANTVLFDDGDVIQGSVLGDYQALVRPPPCDREPAVFRAMDAIGYDAGTLGNHEFNYGLPYLSKVTGTPMHVEGVPPGQRCAGPHYPLVLSNVFGARDGKPLYAPWRIITRRIHATAPDGHAVEATLRVGVLGFAPPPIMQWDKRHLDGRATVMGVVEAARRYLPALRARHPDLVVALLHGGLDAAPYTPQQENAGMALAEVPGIDALLLGHMHDVFPGPRFASLAAVDDRRGTVHGVPAVMGGFFGKDLGLIHLQLRYVDGRWVSNAAAARSEVWPICDSGGACVPPDPAIGRLVAATHHAAIAYVNTPIGHSDFRMSSYFADLGNVTALGVVNAAQADYVRRWIAANRPDLRHVPVLSAAAAFRNGAGGAGDYTDVAAGALTLRSAADLYFYPNTLAAVRIDGEVLKAWLERAAQRFNRIDPDRTAPQALVDSRFPGFNFDQIQGGVHYVIDVSQPPGRRIVSLTYRGRPVAPSQRFIVATNNYRAGGGGHFPGLDKDHLLLNAPDASREVLVQWLRGHPQLRRDEVPGRSWRFAPLHTRGPVTVRSAAGTLDVAREAGLDGLHLLHADADGMATYAVDLQP